MPKQRIAVGLSGGVDSAVAAALLLEQGFAVEGVTLLLNDNCSESIIAARAVCDALRIPHRTVDLRQVFAEHVIAPFYNAYAAGLTPNPCVACNSAVKFGAFLDWTLDNGFDGLATGHYAGVAERGGRRNIIKAADRRKDQSYFLCMLTQRQLSRAYFPLADMDKQSARAYARTRGLPAAEIKDSQDVCFIPGGDCAAFLAQRLPPTPGFIVDAATDNIVGRHDGVHGYTVGQRKGLGGLGAKKYVRRLDVKTGTVYVCDNDDLFTPALSAFYANWMAFDPTPAVSFNATAKIRSAAPEVACAVTPLAGGRFTVTFETPQRAVTPGQVCAVYDGEVLIAGGVIE